MRRVLPLLWLLAFALAQAAPAACPLEAQARQAHVPEAHPHAGHGAHGKAPVRHSHAPDSHPASCSVASTCAAGAVVQAEPTLLPQDVPAAPSTLPAPSFYSSPTSSADPPPPRLPALT
jgi:hypothetical protein